MVLRGNSIFPVVRHSEECLAAISTLRNLFSWWEEPRTIPTITLPLLHIHNATHWPTRTPLQQPPPIPIHRPFIPPALQPQQPHNAPKVHPKSQRVASPITQPTVKFTLTASPRVEAPNSIAHGTCSCTTTDKMFP